MLSSPREANKEEERMKKLAVMMTVIALVMVGATMALAQDVPQALKGVNLTSAQVVSNAQAQQVRGTAPGWGLDNGPPGLVNHISSDGQGPYVNGFNLAGNQAVTASGNKNQEMYHSRAVQWYIAFKQQL
jgi:hypothetical protein